METKIIKNFVKTIYILLSLSLAGCVIGHQDYKRYLDMDIGKNIKEHPPFDSDNAGKLIRSDYLLGGEGLTHITEMDNGTLRFHYSAHEVLSNYSIQDYIGKCLIYYDVNPKSYVIISWGFDVGGNPLSCRTWS
jgi:hypothetical protein